MKLVLHELLIDFKQSQERLAFKDFNYFYGQIGAGKSTIARLINFCFGAELAYTPALQQEFVAAMLTFEVNGKSVVLTRTSGENQVRARWHHEGKDQETILRPGAQSAQCDNQHGPTSVSELLFTLAGIKAPHVRAGQEGQTEQLSFADIFRFCYLEQEGMDNSFFGLEKAGHSRDVMRVLVGWHDEDVPKLQAQLDDMRRKRNESRTAARTLRQALEGEQIPTQMDIQQERVSLYSELERIDKELAAVRNGIANLRPHAIEGLQNQARALARKINAVETLVAEIDESISRDNSHLNTLSALQDRKKRAEVAQAILKDVAFEDCPACFRHLPPHPSSDCPVCGQNNHSDHPETPGNEGVDADIKMRVAELTERIDLQQKERARGLRDKERVLREKEQIDAELNRVSQNYDSAYLSRALEPEAERRRIQQRLSDMKEPERLSKRLEAAEEEVIQLTGKEAELKEKLKQARAQASQNKANLELLKQLFADCLVRARLPGYSEGSRVEIEKDDFIPKVYQSGTGKVFGSFGNMGSGGKKAFFKCCFAVAVHRLAARVNVIWPTLLIIDSPMKSISERENKEQFAGFHEMLYDLSQSELKETQFIIMDKELFPPKTSYELQLQLRHMTVNDPANPPLIPYYHGQ